MDVVTIHRFLGTSIIIGVLISTALNLSSKENNVDDNSLGQFRTKKNVFFYELGFGIDLYLEWFKFSPSIRGVFAFSDEVFGQKTICHALLKWMEMEN